MNDPPVTLRKLILLTAGCLALSVVFFSPRLWLMRQSVPGSFQWDRAHTYLAQCEEPLRRDIEPAMQWRLLPPVVCHALRLSGNAPLALPWLGVIAVTFYTAVLFRRRLDNWRFIAGGTLLFATTSAVLVPVGWLGINDAWIWLGLLAVAFGPGRWTVPVACLLCPGIDERFLIGLPLAWMVARIDRKAGDPPRIRDALWLLPYVATRLLFAQTDAVATSAAQHFLVYQLFHVAPLVPLIPLGWWMGLRSGWFAVAYAGWNVPRELRWLAGSVLMATLAVTFVLASDLSRSIAILVPVMFLGCFDYARRHPGVAPRGLLIAGGANLLIPAVHVIYNHLDPINPLPIELMRLLRPS